MAKPVVDELERELFGTGATVVNVDVMSRVGREIASRHGVRGVPALIVFNGAGETLLRQIGRVDKDSVLGTIQGRVSTES